MYPGAHGQFGDEDVAALGEEDGRLGRNHLDLRVGLHHLLDPGQGQLVLLVVMRVIFERVDRLLPIRGENIPVIALETLVDL